MHEGPGCSYTAVALQAIKKAKEFEIRKVSRRLKHARESQDKDGGTTGGQAAAVQKLQDQLEAVKAIGLDGLTKEVRTLQMPHAGS